MRPEIARRSKMRKDEERYSKKQDEEEIAR